jgi:hypothetical protein
LGLIAHDTNTAETKVQASLLIAKQKFERHPRLSTSNMTAPLHGTSMIVSGLNGLAVCTRQRNLQQTFALLNSSSHAFRLKAFSRFNSMRASNSSANSSVNLATSNLHAHNLQVLNSISLNWIPCHHSNKQTQDFVYDYIIAKQIFFCRIMTFII